MSGDETLARHLFDRLARGVPLTELCERVISPALYRIGEDWAAGTETIAAEHRASAICERLIAARARQPQGRPRGIAVASTPPGERHGLPALMATACLREDRWLVHHLAADLPVDEVTGLARLAGASLVVLSSATTESAERAREAADDITRSAAGLHVLTGQPGDPLSLLRQLARATTADGRGGGAVGRWGQGQRSLSRSANAEISSRCPASSAEAGGTARRVVPFAAWAATSSGGHVDRSPPGVLQRARVPARGPRGGPHLLELAGALGYSAMCSVR